MLEEAVLGAIAVGQLIFIVCMLYALKYLRRLSVDTTELKTIAETLENFQLLRGLEHK